MDIVDFGPAGAPPETQASSRMSWLPTIPVGLPLGLAVAGAVLAAVGIFGPWQTLASGQLPFPSDGYKIMVDQTGILGYVLLVGYLGVFSVTAVAHFGPTRPRRIAAVAGAGLCLAMLLMAALMAQRLSSSSPYMSPFSSQVGNARFSLGWGLYCGVASIVAFGLSVLALNPVRIRRASPAPARQEPDDFELDVRVESA